MCVRARACMYMCVYAYALLVAGGWRKPAVKTTYLKWALNKYKAVYKDIFSPVIITELGHQNTGIELFFKNS